MPKALSMDLRSRVLAAVDSGLSCQAAARHFGVSAASAIRWAAHRRRDGSFAPKQQGGDRRSAAIEAHAALIRSLVDEMVDITLIELQAALAERGVQAGVGSLWRFLRRHDLTLKKSPRTRPSRAARTS